MKITKQIHRQKSIQNLIFVALFISIITALAWISTKYDLHADLTAGNRNSLSDETIELLKSVAGPINIRSYHADDISMNKAVIEILSRYQHHKSNLTFTLLNPDLEIEQSKIDGITGYGQTVVNYNNKQEIINVLNEQNIGNALLRLSRDKKPILFFLQGHGERNPTNATAIGYSTISNQLQIKGFTLRALNLLRDTINANDGTLIIAGASKEFLPGEIDQIQDFITQGGNMFWLQDPGSDNSLDKISDLLDIEFLPGVVVDTDPQLRKVLQLSHPAKLPIISYKMHAITNTMQNLTLFITASAINAKMTKEWKTTPLLLTQETSWAETEDFILDVKYDQNKGDIKGPLSIGLALERTLKDRDTKQQRIVVIGDSDYLANNNIGHGGNLDFTLNALNWLSQNDKLISIKTKSAPDYKLLLSDTAMAVIGFGFLLILPSLLCLTGIFIWLKRRNR